MKIFKQKPGVISKDETWVCIHQGYLYTRQTLQKLINILNTQWQHDKNLVG